MMKHRFLLSILACLLSASIAAAQGECPAVIQNALAAANTQCASTGRNQICYGNNALEAEPQPDAAGFTFANAGDIEDVAAISTLKLAGLDASTGVWGLVLMRIQANIPNTLPGQNVTIMLFGDSEIRNAATSVAQQMPPQQPQTIASGQNVDVHELPSTAGVVLGSVAPGAAITATGRTTDSAWIRVFFGDQTGWIPASALATTEGIADLMAVEPGAGQFGPMQAFYFTAGVGQAACSQVPGNGMLVQTPSGVKSIELSVNDVRVNMGSTIYFTVNQDRQMAVYSLEGGARVTAAGKTRTSVEGTRVRIPLNDDMVADNEPFEIESYTDNDTLEFLPVDGLERDIEIHDPLDDEELALYQQYDEVFDNIPVEDVDETFDYVMESWDDEDFDIASYLTDEMDYTDFNDELTTYFEDELGYDFSDEAFDTEAYDTEQIDAEDTYDDFAADDEADYIEEDYGDEFDTRTEADYSADDYSSDYEADTGADYADEAG